MPISIVSPVPSPVVSSTSSLSVHLIVSSVRAADSPDTAQDMVASVSFRCSVSSAVIAEMKNVLA